MSIYLSKDVKSASSLKQPALNVFYTAKPRKWMTMKKLNRDAWANISSALAPENLHEDGEISAQEADEKYRNIHLDAQCLFEAGFFCPADIAENSDDDLSSYVGH